MFQPGGPDWLNMTGGQLEDFNRKRCADLPFGGRGDATCAQFRIESLGIGAPDTDENRTSQPSLFDRLSNATLGLGPVGTAIGAGKAALDAGENVIINKYLPNIVLIVIGIVLLIAGVMLWGRSIPSSALPSVIRNNIKP
jgi:hypothetical protein